MTYNLQAMKAKEKKGFVDDIEKLTLRGKNFRQVLYTTKQSQLVLMSLKSGEEIGEEIHASDQFFKIEEGAGEVLINGKTTKIKSGTGIVVPGGAKHNVINTGKSSMKIYIIYSPPNHPDKVIDRTPIDGEKDEKPFDGKTTE